MSDDLPARPVSDPIIDACRWHVDPEAKGRKQRALDHFRDCYGILLSFLRAEGLLTDASFGVEVSNWYRFELRDSHLTAEGLALVGQCIGTWNPSFGHGHTQRHLVQWRRKLARLRSQA